MTWVGSTVSSNDARSASSSEATADICDHYPQTVEVLDSTFTHFGKALRGVGSAILVKLTGNNKILFDILQTDGRGKVLTVQVQSDNRPAVIGYELATVGFKNGWKTIIVDGAVRDVAQLRKIDICILAREARPFKQGTGAPGMIVGNIQLGNVELKAGDNFFIDEDGVVVLPG